MKPIGLTVLAVILFSCNSACIRSNPPEVSHPAHSHSTAPPGHIACSPSSADFAEVYPMRGGEYLFALATPKSTGTPSLWRIKLPASIPERVHDGTLERLILHPYLNLAAVQTNQGEFAPDVFRVYRLPEFVPVTPGRAGFMLGWSPDGALEAISRTAPYSVDIYRTDDSRGPLLTIKGAQEISWSPNSKYFAELSSLRAKEAKPGTPERYQLSVYSREGLKAGPRDIGKWFGTFCFWSTDGNSVFFLRGERGARNLLRYDLCAMKETVVTGPPQFKSLQSFASWSRDYSVVGLDVMRTDGSTGVYVLRTDDMKWTHVGTGLDVSSPRLSSTGLWVAYYSREKRDKAYELAHPHADVRLIQSNGSGKSHLLPKDVTSVRWVAGVDEGYSVGNDGCIYSVRPPSSVK